MYKKCNIYNHDNDSIILTEGIAVISILKGTGVVPVIFLFLCYFIY